MNATVAQQLQDRIRQAIPISDAMGYAISQLDDTSITVEAPLDPNINVHHTAFAGSIYALGALTAWALVTHLIDRRGLNAELVIAGARIDYAKPIREALHCTCQLTDEDAEGFTQRLQEIGRARVAVDVTIGSGPAARLHAELHARRT